MLLKENVAVIFDLDGTLTPTMDAIRSLFVTRVQQVSGREFTMVELNSAYHHNLKIFMKNLGILDLQVVDQLESEIRELESRQQNALFYPGLSDLIIELTGQRIHLYLWTLRYQDSALKILKHNNVLRNFIDFHCGDHLWPKPYAQGIKEKLTADYSQMLVIGDSVADIEGAKALGATAVAVTWAKTLPAEKLLSHGADVLVDTVADLRKYLLGV